MAAGGFVRVVQLRVNLLRCPQYDPLLEMGHAGKRIVGLIKPRGIHITEAGELYLLVIAGVLEIRETLSFASHDRDLERRVR